jgi:surface polysaccharide O-acyltransferase-like enzyme
VPTSVAVWRNIGVMRGIGIVLVALNHASMGAFGVLRETPQLVGLSAIQVVVEVLAKSLTPVCLPLFLCASGFFTVRFSSTWTLAAGNARRILQRYLLWSIPGFVVVVGLENHPLDWNDTLSTFVGGGPWPTYWFLILLVQLSLLAPLLARLVARAPGLALGLAILLQVGAIAVAAQAAMGHPVLPSHLVILHLHFFIGGMLLSARGTRLVALVAAHRTLVGVLVAVLGVAACAESVWLGGVFGDGGPGSFVYAGERISLQLFAVALILFIAALLSSTAPWHKALDWVGLRSLAVLLMMDPAVRLTTAALWHVDQIVFGVVRQDALPPAWMMNVALVPVLFMVAIGVPTVTFHLIETRLGKGVRAFLFA